MSLASLFEQQQVVFNVQKTHIWHRYGSLSHYEIIISHPAVQYNNVYY
jgi:hypothetical protein